MPGEFFTPNTTSQAYRFGRKSARAGHKRMPREAFLKTANEHPYPSSLWRAYIRGLAQGREDRKGKS